MKEKISLSQIDAINHVGKNGRVRIFNSYLHLSTTKALIKRKLFEEKEGYVTLTEFGKKAYESLKP